MHSRIFILIIVVTTALAHRSSLDAQQPAAEADSLYIDGLLVAKKKYSFALSGPDGEIEVKIDPTTVIAVRVIRPQLDWGNRQLTGIIPASAVDGRTKNNATVQYKLHDRIFFRQRFDSKHALETITSKDNITLKRMVLSKIPLPNAISDDEKPEWTGELKVDQATGQLKVALGDEEKTIEFQSSTLLIEGFSLLDLKPYQADVFVNAFKKERAWIARRVEFVPRVSLTSLFEKPQPKCLVIGDIVSFNYMPALIKELKGEAIVHHPNTNCQGSASFKHLHRWIGLTDENKFKWDVIAFNFGHHDSSIDKQTYQANLKASLNVLKKSGAKLIWLDSTPIPYGFNDPSLKPGDFIPAEKQFDFEFEESNPSSLKPGRMKGQNRWAAEVFQSHPEVSAANLWNVVKKDVDGKYKKWWYGRSLGFRYQEAEPLAREIATSIREALKNSAQK